MKWSLRIKIGEEYKEVMEWSAGIRNGKEQEQGRNDHQIRIRNGKEYKNKERSGY